MKKVKSSHSQFSHRPSVTVLARNSTSFGTLKDSVSGIISGGDVLLRHDTGHASIETQNANVGTSHLPAVNSKTKKIKKIKFSNVEQSDQDYLTEILALEFPSVHCSSLENILNDEANNHLKFLYIVSLYTINNYIGTCSSTSKSQQELKLYVDHLISLSPIEKDECLKRVRKIKSPEYVLSVTIIEAVDIHFTDADGLSDPYCKIWMNGIKEPVSKTRVKERTLNPSWNESFSFQIHDFARDVLHIQVWDKDPKGIRANIRELRDRGAKGSLLFCREFCQNLFSCSTGSVDDFIGEVDFLVKDIYSEGIDNFSFLKDLKGNTIDSQLHISVEYKVPRPTNIQENLKRHMMLTKLCYDQNSEQNGDLELVMRQSKQLLSLASITLLLQHRVQSGLYRAEDLLIRFIVLVNLLHHKNRLNYQLLYCLIEDSQKHIEELMNVEKELENDLDDLLRKAINVIFNGCNLIFSTLHSVDFLDDSICLEFEFVLKCTFACCNLLVKDFPWTTLKSEASDWLEQVAVDIQKKDHKIRTQFIIQKINSIKNFHEAADLVFKRVFPNQSYTFITYENLDSIFSKNFKPHVNTISQESLNLTGDARQNKTKDAFALFLKIKELDEYIHQVSGVSKNKLKISEFREWFGSTVIEGWFQCKLDIVLLKLPEIIGNDNLENMPIDCAGRVEKQSLSVKYTVNIIRTELIYLWKQVCHPKYPQMDRIFLEKLHFSLKKYAECLLDRILSRKIHATFQSEDKKNLCVIANNLWSLAIFAKETISETVKNLPLVCYDTKFSLQLMGRVLCDDLCHETKKDILAAIEKVVSAANQKKQTEAITKYTKKIKKLLEEVQELMAFEIYLLYLEGMWKFIIFAVNFFKNLHEGYDSKFSFLKKICSKPNISEGLLCILTETQKLCYIDPDGKLIPFMWTVEFLLLKKELQELIVYG